MLSLPRLALAAALVAAGVAGCLGGPGDEEVPRAWEPLTQPTLSIGPHLDHTFTGTTGTQLYVDYVLPDGPGPFPTILVFTPYQSPEPVAPGGEGGAEDPPYDGGLVEYFVPRGYAVAFADVRGNHNAGGCIDQTGPGQWQDGHDYVEWLGTQPWSNGKVGMHGLSYDGETQYTTAMAQPPHLATIVPMASVSNQYGWSFYQGVPYETQPLAGMAAYLAGSAVPSTRPQDAPRYPEKLECQDEAMAAGLDFSGDWTPFWQERDYRPLASRIQVPVLNVHGLADWNVRPDHVDPLFNNVPTVKRALYGQWRHQDPLHEDWQEILHAWYDRFLLGRENGILERLPPVLVQDSEGSWHGLSSFPPLQQDWLVLELSADGSLRQPGQAVAGEAVLRDVPAEAVTDPTGGLAAALAGQAGVPTQADFTWVTPHELRLVGRPQVLFTATSSAASTHWGVHLWVEGDGCLLADGGGQDICTNAGYLDSRHREGLDRPSDVEPGEPYEVAIRMYPQYDVIPAGATLHLTVVNNDATIMQDPTASENRVLLGGDRPAYLQLPLAPPDEWDLADRLPPLPVRRT